MPQNSSDLSWTGDLWGCPVEHRTVGWGVGPACIGLVEGMHVRIVIWGVLRPGQCLGPFFVFPETFLSSFCGVAGCTVLPGEATAVGKCHCYGWLHMVCNNV